MKGSQQKSLLTSTKEKIFGDKNRSNKVFSKECFHLIKWDDVHLVIEVGMHRARNNHQFFVISPQFLVSVSAEIAGVRFLTMN